MKERKNSKVTKILIVLIILVLAIAAVVVLANGNKDTGTYEAKTMITENGEEPANEDPKNEAPEAVVTEPKETAAETEAPAAILEDGGDLVITLPEGEETFGE